MAPLPLLVLVIVLGTLTLAGAYVLSGS